jgi:hypothetical protein
MPLNRQHLADIYRPAGPKIVVTGQPILTTAASGGGNIALTQAIDLSLPIRGLRFVLKGRLVVGTAAFTTVNPEGLLNLLSSIVIQGTNARQQGNLTLWNIDLATAWVLQRIMGPTGAAFFLVTPAGGGALTEVPTPTTPFPSGAVAANPYFQGSTGTYDFIIGVDFPFHPHQSNSFGREPLTIPQYLVRNEEWKDSIQILITGATQAGNSTGALGVAAATTTIAFTAFGTGAGSPTLDIYSLPVLMGLNLKDQILPGVLSRVSTPVTQPVQSAGNGVSLLNMQKQPTPRVFFKMGTGTVVPSFASLIDTVPNGPQATGPNTIGILLGGNRNVRNKVDILSHKMIFPDVYLREPIQGYSIMDFMENGNPDASYPGQDIGDGATFQLVADVLGATANGLALVVQEQILHQPSGALMDF